MDYNGHVVKKVNVGNRVEGVHYVNESHHNFRSTQMCVWVNMYDFVCERAPIHEGWEDGGINSVSLPFPHIQYTQSAVPASAIKMIFFFWSCLSPVLSVCFEAHSPTSAGKDLRQRNWQLQCGEREAVGGQAQTDEPYLGRACVSSPSTPAVLEPWLSVFLSA